MKLVSTTDEEYKQQIGEECSLTYSGGSAFLGLETKLIRTSTVRQITREGNIVFITTENKTYTLED